MSSPKNLFKPRGSALLEVMIAGAVLLIGLTGISLILVRAASNSRDARLSTTAASAGLSKLNAVAGLGTTIVATIGDGGGPILTEDGGTTGLTQWTTISNVSDAGVTAYEVNVTVTWAANRVYNQAGLGKFFNVTTVVSEAASP